MLEKQILAQCTQLKKLRFAWLGMKSEIPLPLNSLASLQSH